jgi:hypothetical protein
MTDHERMAGIGPARQPDLFGVDVDLGAGLERGDACIAPIGRRRARRPRPVRPRRPSPAVMLAELRAYLHDEVGSITMILRRIERALDVQGTRLADTSEGIEGIRIRVTAIERQLGICEQPQTPRISRRRPLQ